MIRTLKLWSQLTRDGMPDFVVVRRPLVWEGSTLIAGDPVPVSLSGNRIRLRQFYEQRRIAPVEPTEARKPPVQAPPIKPIPAKHAPAAQRRS